MEIFKPFLLLLFHQTVDTGPQKATGMLNDKQDFFFFYLNLDNRKPIMWRLWFNMNYTVESTHGCNSWFSF